MTAMARANRNFAHANAMPLVVAAVVVLGLAVVLLALASGLPWSTDGLPPLLNPGGPDLHGRLA